jgi:hypothetical protein
MRCILFIALRFKERDLERSHGEQYRAHRRRAGLLLPVPRLKKLGQTPAVPDANPFPIR